MDPTKQFCHIPTCPARGQTGQGNIRVHSQQERRYRCTTCGKTFSATTGTPYYRLHQEEATMTQVLTLLCHGCPVQAIVAAFALDERTVAHWQAQAGQHAQRVHEHLVEQGRVDLKLVQADELWVKRSGGRSWMAMAMAVPSRLWLGGAVSATRDRSLIKAVVGRVRASAKRLDILVCTDGLSTYVKAFQQGFRHKVFTGRRGAPHLVEESGLLLGQVVKRRVKWQVKEVTQHAVLGTIAAILAVIVLTGTGTMINTAAIERLNATFRSALAPLTRRGRAIAHQEATLRHGMWLVGCVYNFCWYHNSLRVQGWQDFLPVTRERTPAMAAALTDHCWTIREFLHYAIPLPAWVAPKRRGRPPKPRLTPVTRVAT